ncbi:hypothetical protein [Phytoactinopolyspora mesophila]|uniref:Uncharacterized protein n=1 Tax=Phytoactinopolyspora mesophila TaxID=2650750 RepID=A0A7K3MCC3_9ACTN|nr:hypothetical protein [Phytoactinopolyspora mesophila]NDL60830.1 hypothetical protein [Phytoactinopolyspora mesophila]
MDTPQTVARCPFAMCRYVVAIDLDDPMPGLIHLRRHLTENDKAYGRELISALARVQFDPVAVELLGTLPHPGVGAVDRGIGERDHAAAPGPMTLDGWAPALCVSLATVRVEKTATGEPVRAVARWDGRGGVRSPACRRCRNRLKLLDR